MPTKDADEHFAEICRRLETASPDDFTLVKPLRIAVLLHEVSPERLPAVLDQFGFTDYTPIVTAVIGAFGRLWKLRDAAETLEFVSAHRAYLEPLLLFELVHEDAPTASMRRVAGLGGLRETFEGWVGRLA